LKFYNTLTKRVDEFVPYEEGIVRMYTCGPTVYYYAHIGNLRTYVFEDILEKGLTYCGYQVKRVMNITDVGHMTSDADTGEDKMEKGAKREGKTVYEIADFYTKAFFEDLEKLNVKKPEIVEKASDHIDQYIKMVEQLLQKGYAYISNGNVYFDISKIPNYYELSGKVQEELMVGVRDTVENDEAKRNPFDFGLWFTLSKFENQAMKWDSPWGVGYPGWHIECSGIAALYLGEYIDIHCGGVDNIFPHHSNEIAQSESYFGHKWCNFWMHGEHLNDAKGKMSKSNGEILTISTLEKQGFSPLSYRYFCLGSHYRKQLLFSMESLNIASSSYRKLKSKVQSIKEEGEYQEDLALSYQEKFKEAIGNDLNTSMMLTILFDVLKDDKLSGLTKISLVKSFDTVLSLDLLKKEEKVDDDLDSFVQEKIQERILAKQNKDYQKADAIRDELLAMGIRLKDGKEKTTYERL